MPHSLLQSGQYSADWIKAFYDQAGIWWGADAEEADLVARVQAVARLCGPGKKTILDLGAGPGSTAAALADAGHDVTAVEFSPQRAAYAHELARRPHAGMMTVVEEDFYTMQLATRFDVVCYWDGFGVGSDADQRRVLRRMAQDWLAPGGCALVDIFNPIRPARDAGKEEILAPLPAVATSVEMNRRCHFDPVHCRWIDEWQPTGAPEQALAQTVRCYTPSDLLLLLEGTGLALKRAEVCGEEIAVHSSAVTLSGPLLDAWEYLTLLVPEE